MTIASNLIVATRSKNLKSNRLLYIVVLIYTGYVQLKTNTSPQQKQHYYVLVYLIDMITSILLLTYFKHTSNKTMLQVRYLNLNQNYCQYTISL